MTQSQNHSRFTIPNFAFLAAILCMPFALGTEVVDSTGPEERACSVTLGVPSSAKSSLFTGALAPASMVSGSARCLVTPTFLEPSELIAAFAIGKLDAVWVDNQSALDLLEYGDAEVFAQALTPDGRDAYRSLLVVRTDSQLGNLDDILRTGPALVLGTGDDTSTFGHWVPQYFAFLRRGVKDPAQHFSKIRTGSHQVNLKRLEKREVDVAAVMDWELEALRTNQPEIGDQFRVVWESPPFPPSVVVWSTRIPLERRKKLLTTFSELGVTHSAQANDELARSPLFRFKRFSNLQMTSIVDVESYVAWKRIDQDEHLDNAERLFRLKAFRQRVQLLQGRLKQPSSIP